MKRIFYLVFAIILFVACDDDDNNGRSGIWDMAPINVTLYVEDAEGNDLLNPKNENNILDRGIKAIYGGKTLGLNEKPAETKYYLPHFNGLTTREHEGKTILEFGEFNGADSQEVEFVIDWGEDDTDKISFIHKYDYDHKKDRPITETKFFLNGKEVDKIFKIVK